MKLRSIALTLLAASITSAALGAGCGNGSAPNPFQMTGGGGSIFATGGGGAGGAIFDAGQDADPELGGPCLDDGQCDDMIACTFDACDTTVGRCRFVPDDSQCQDGLYCDGVERCDLKLGCVAGTPVSCDDSDSCTIDTCVEATQSCTHAPRDADGDGDPDWHCPGGHDCNDDDPNVNSHHPEVCGNGVDDDCDGHVDEAPCVSAANDTCLDPLQINASGTYPMSTVGCKFDYPTSCGIGSMMGATDVVAAVVLPAGPPVDVEVTAVTLGVPVAVAIAGQCGDPSSEIACGKGYSTPQYGQEARARGRGLGSPTQQTAYPVYVETAPGAAVSLDVQILPPAPAPANLTCGTAAPITPGVPVSVEVLDGPQNLASACTTQLGQQVFAFDLAATSDVDVYASSVDGDGVPVVSLRDAGCALPTDEITCQENASLHIVRHSLAAGTYDLMISASSPTAMEVTVDVASPTMPPPDQTCTGSPVLTPNQTLSINLAGHEADVSLGCLAGAVDAAYELDLASASDVLVVERIANGDTGAAGLAQPSCTPATTLLCITGQQSPIRGSKRNVPAGPYRVVAESLLGEDVEITAFVRNAVPPTLVLGGDGCSGVFVIPPTGGFFQGNTANAHARFPAGCDAGGVGGDGAPDQLLELQLTQAQRVVFDMEGSAYNTIVDVRQGPSCPGTEIANACAVGYGFSKSYLDLELDPGTYFIQIDGYDLDKGQWFLDVRVVDPLIRLAGAAALAAILPERLAEARPLSADDEARLDRGEVVKIPLDLDTPRGDYFGGVAYAVIDAPVDEVMEVLLDPASYTSILPLTLEARVTGRPGGSFQVYFKQGARLGTASYTLLARRESLGLLRFWLDPSQPHDVADCWGYFRVLPWGKRASLLTYAALLRLDAGLVKLLFTETIRRYALTTPGLVRAYVHRRRGAAVDAER